MQNNISAHNLPLQLDISKYKSLNLYKKEVQGKAPFHLTLVFTKMSDFMINKKAQSIINDIQNDPSCQNFSQNHRFQFTRFRLFGKNADILVAEYIPVDNQGQFSRQQYKKFVQDCRRMVRRAADQMGKKGKKVSRVIDQKKKTETCCVDGKKVYVMDIRPPIAHVTIKTHATLSDLQAVKQLSTNKPFPQDLEVRLDNLSVRRTKPAKL